MPSRECLQQCVKPREWGGASAENGIVPKLGVVSTLIGRNSVTTTTTNDADSNRNVPSL